MAMPALAPWQQRAYDQACEAADAGRLAHGLLICGMERLGKHAVAVRLAQRLLCQAVLSGEPCGECRSCRFFAAGTHPDFRAVSFVANNEGTRMRTEIVMDQVREVREMLALTPQYGGAQIVLIDPAEAINHSAGNALLKTLEEPRPGRYLWLVTSNPARIPATIRSRCQRLELHMPARAEALAWLQSQGVADAAAREALDAARGHPGLAHAWLEDGSLTLRREVATDLAAIEKGGQGVMQVAQRWVADERIGLRLRFAADLALQQASHLTDPGRTRSLAAWFDAANRTRDLLRTTVRADLAVAELLMGWRTDSPAPGQHRTGSR